MKESSYSRRRFLQTTSIIAATSGLSLKSANLSMYRGDGEFVLNESPLRLGLMTYNVGRSWDIDTVIKNCTETKFEHVQLRATHRHGVEVSLNRRQRDEVKKRFFDAGLAISLASAFQYHSLDGGELRSNIEGTKEYLQLAADVGALGIRVFPNAVPDEGDRDRERVLEQIGRSVSEVADVGRDLGVELRLEQHGRGTSNIPVIRRILDYADNPHVYVIWNCARSDWSGGGLPSGYEGMGLKAQFEMVADRIRNVHLRELFSEYPWRELFGLLSKTRYQGYCDAELSNESSEPVRMMHNYRALFLALQNAI